MTDQAAQMKKMKRQDESNDDESLYFDDSTDNEAARLNLGISALARGNVKLQETQGEGKKMLLTCWAQP